MEPENQALPLLCSHDDTDGRLTGTITADSFSEIELQPIQVPREWIFSTGYDPVQNRGDRGSDDDQSSNREPITRASSKVEAPSSQREWESPVRWCAWLNLAILIINIAVIVIMLGIAASKPSGITFGSIIVRKGSCSGVKAATTGLHLLINMLSVTLSATSNYCSHILIAPSRKDVDEAHSRRVWVVIGTFSFRNIMKLSMRRKFDVLLRYECERLQSLREYSGISISNTGEGAYNISGGQPDGWNSTDLRSSIASGDFEVLSVEECIDAYTLQYLSNRCTVIGVTKEISNNSLYFSGYGYPKGFQSIIPQDVVIGSLHISQDFGSDSAGYEWMCLGITTENGFARYASCSKNILLQNLPWELEAVELTYSSRI
ncbi:hypothetical protein BO71DRAFT_430233 [Aspergillus ellipticus CBS 707.79]|uniref:DUF6536 domain-containing protein n=1 Tax=Aspergillus ellipticus CBS 707.79 TaxID=1448320 RepID=A0A319D9W0_9EURO|nr:hypothetical protein BO71DRAFT_430233 [Aspergillus ellipticus CBS 707.79]